MATRKRHRIIAQGVELIDLAIARVRRDPRSIAGFCGDYPLVEPRHLAPEVIAGLTFPSGKPLPPSLRRWLAFDASWLQGLGWFASLEPPVFAPRTLGQIADAEYGPRWRHVVALTGMELADLNHYAAFDPDFPECFLLPDGTDSRRVFAVTEPDDLGEYPVLAIDYDEPYVAIMYPGFDVYLADLAGVLGLRFGTYEDLHEDERYAARLALHARRLFGGRPSIAPMDLEAIWEELDGEIDGDASDGDDRT
jgi:hypothetical protein